MTTREELDPEGLAADAALQRPTSVAGRLHAVVWSFLCSLPRAMWLLLVLGVACFVGMFFDQTLTYEEHAAQWASQAWKLRLFTFLEMNDVFGSWWFVMIIGYLLISITACSIERFPKIWIDALYPRKHLSDEQVRGIKQVYRARILPEQVEKARSIVQAVFGRRAFHERRDGTTFFFLERHRFARFGVYIIHAGLVTIFAGGILVNFTKIDGMMMIAEGRPARLVRVWGPGRLPFTHDLGFDVRCEDFRLKTFIDGAPMEFESDLSVWDPDSPVNPVLRKTIQVNDPLEYKGYTFYQASYNPIPGDQRVKLDVGPRGGKRMTYDLSIGEKVTMADGTAFVPLETIPEMAGLGAAVRVQQVNPDGHATSFVVFRSYPDFDRDVRRGAYDVQFHGFDQQYATGIQVGRVPFIPVVFVGFLVMFVGMFTAFFLSHRRYWARLQPVDPAAVDGPVELVVAGAARRHQYAFDEEFAKIRELLELAFGQGESVADRARALRAARQRRGGASVDAGLEEQRSPPESTGGATTGKTTDQHQRGDAPPDATTTTSGKVGA
ncbi:MAG: cytochrome c biogenesis protein ResB [Deltaproteobacteria bacterium]|nr:cytochrome c biogenesis protein ResB [Deltaproteobacteria bacterium]